MTKIYTPEYLDQNLQVPDTILPFVQAIPRLLPGETDDDFYRLFEIMATDILPDTDIEWLWTIDLAYLWFDIQRYRRWKNAIILTGRRAALEFALAKTNPDALLVGGMNPVIRGQARMDAEALRVETDKHNPLSLRLESHGYDADAINATAFVQGLQSLATIEKFLASARHQVAIMLRQVGLHREFTRRANEAISRYLAEKELEEQAKPKLEKQFGETLSN